MSARDGWCKSAFERIESLLDKRFSDEVFEELIRLYKEISLTTPYKWEKEMAERAIEKLSRERMERKNAELVAKLNDLIGVKDVDGAIHQKVQFTVIQPSENRYRLDSLVGYEHLKKLIYERVIFPHVFPFEASKLGIKPPRALFLTGPPGVGKTTFALAVAGELKKPLISLDERMLSHYIFV